MRIYMLNPPYFRHFGREMRWQDAGSGLRVFKASLLPEFQDLPDGLSFTPGMSTKILQIGMNYQEIPIE